MRFFIPHSPLLFSLLLSSATLGLFNTAAFADAQSVEEVFLSSDASSSQAENILLHSVESRTEIEQKLLDLGLHHQAGGGVELLMFMDCSADQEVCFHAEFHDTPAEVVQAAAGAVAMQGGLAALRASEKILVVSLGGLIAWVYSMAKRRHDPGQFALPLPGPHANEAPGQKGGGRKSPDPKPAPALIPTREKAFDEARNSAPLRPSDVEVYVHSNCDGYYGGGWAALLSYKHNGCRALLSGSAAPVTSSVIELLAAIHGLEHLGKQDLIADVYTDSGYVYLGFEEKRHLEQWIRNGWKDAKGNPVALKELWLKLRALVDRHAVRFHYVPSGSRRAQSKLVQREAQSAYDQRAHFEHYNP